MTRSLLLIISGSVAAFKVLEVIRRLREHDIRITTVLTQGGAEFLTPLSVAALSGGEVYSELFSLKDESEMGHIRLSRENDLIAVIPASADIIAKMAHGLCDDLATATLLATDKPVLVAPAMNTKMWDHLATRRNLRQLRQDGITVLEPATGGLACGETGQGRLAEVDVIVEAVLAAVTPATPLKGCRALVTSGPTQEAIDPVRFMTNRSSGKQGNAIAAALSAAGAEVTLVTGPTAEPVASGIQIVRVESAEEMLAACQSALPVDIAVFCAAVADWKVAHPSRGKLKKRADAAPPVLTLIPNPDILHTIAHLPANRPQLVIGFAAETENLEQNAREKRTRKGCDWLIANDVSGGQVFGREETSILFMTQTETEAWQGITKQEVAKRLVKKIERWKSGN